MDKPDFEEMARELLGIPDGIDYPGITKYAAALRVVDAAAEMRGMEKSAEIVDLQTAERYLQSEARMRTACSAAIRAEAAKIGGGA